MECSIPELSVLDFSLRCRRSLANCLIPASASCCMAETVKRRLRKRSSASSTDDNLSRDFEVCESDEVLSILNMAGEVMSKLEQVLRIWNGI